MALNALNLSTGKLSIPITLGQLTGPGISPFELEVTYNTSEKLLQQIQTWNEDAPTGIFGLGWTFSPSAFIYRASAAGQSPFVGSTQDKFVLVGGTNILSNTTYPLLLDQSRSNADSGSLQYVTQIKSLLSVNYQVKDEVWIVFDEDGKKYTFGGIGTHAVDLSVRWNGNPTDGQPVTWVGSSLETEGQENYVDTWRLSQIELPSGQKVSFNWSQIQQSVGDNAGLFYTVANYLQSITVDNGTSLQFNYTQKQPFEYPTFRFGEPLNSNNNNNNNDGSSENFQFEIGKQYRFKNAFQDKIETHFLSSLHFIDSKSNEIESIINFDYDFIFHESDFDSTDLQSLQAMNKRILTSIHTIQPPLESAPPYNFDYWGTNDSEFLDNLKAALQKDKNNLFRLSLNSMQLQRTIDERSYNGVFGYLQSIVNKEGGKVIYSYENIADIAGENWDLRLDSPEDLEPPPADYQNNTYKWMFYKIYWGYDQYAIIRWRGQSQNNDSYLTAFQVYEWIGKWVKVQIVNTGGNFEKSDYIVFPAKKNSQPSISSNNFSSITDFALLSLGVGKFIMGFTDIAVGWPVAILHRDACKSGYWLITWISGVGAKQKDNPNNYLIPSSVPGLVGKGSQQYLFQPQMGIGDNTIFFLDIINNQLHLFSIVNNAWQQETRSIYKNNSIVSSLFIGAGSFYVPSNVASASIIGDDVLVMYSSNSTKIIVEAYLPNPIFPNPDITISYFLFHYDGTASIGKDAWSEVLSGDMKFSGSQDPPILITDLDKSKYPISYLFGVSTTTSNGYILGEIFIFDYNAEQLVSRPVIVSWDAFYKSIYFQPFYSPNNAQLYIDKSSSDSVMWGSVVYKTPFLWYGNDLGTVQSANLINVTTATGNPRKYVARYVGGTQQQEVNNHNLGWNPTRSIPFLPDNSDTWEQLASFDSTIGIQKIGKSETYRYYYYQFQVYQDYLWDLQNNIQMGENVDWKDIQRIFNEVEDILNWTFQALLFFISFGESFWLIRGISRFLNFLQFGIGVEGSVISSAISDLMKDGMSFRRTAEGGSQNYFIVGTNVGDSNISHSGQPRSYYKSWNTSTFSWNWVDADPSLLLKNISVAKAPTVHSGTNYKTPLNSLSQDIYRYGSNFVLFSYSSFIIDQGAMVDTGFRRNYESDQISYFRNGILSKLESLPTLKNIDTTFINPIHLSIIKSFSYSIFQGDMDQFLLYSPWGGILAYQPIIYSQYYSVAVTEDSIIEGSTIKNAWYTGGSIDKFNNPPDAPTAMFSASQRLFMAKDEKITGPLSDIVVTKISQYDGIQYLDTHYAYDTKNAIYNQSLGVLYNHISVSSGGVEYQSSIAQFGWTDHYFYNGIPDYLVVTSQSKLPYEPSTDSSNPSIIPRNCSKDLYQYTNYCSFDNLLIGMEYATRQVQYNSNSSQTIEVMRQYNYYVGYYQNCGRQNLHGVVKPLTVAIVAADSAQANYIQNSHFVINYNYSFYDLTQLNKDFSCIVVNNGDSVNLNGSNRITGIETAKLLSTSSSSYHLQDNEVQYQSYDTNYFYGFQSKLYGEEFRSRNLFNLIIQQTNSLRLSPSPINISNVGIESILNCTATVWNSTKSSITGDKYWYPFGVYKWIGSSNNGSVSDTIPWNATTVSDLLTPNLGADWILSNYISSVQDSIVVSSVIPTNGMSNGRNNNLFQGVKTKHIFYNHLNLLALFSGPNQGSTQNGGLLEDDWYYFTSFEPYEESNNNGSPNTTLFNGGVWNITDKMLTSEIFYIGSRSIALIPNVSIAFTTPPMKEIPAQLVISCFYYFPIDNFKLLFSIESSEGDSLYYDAFSPSYNSFNYFQLVVSTKGWISENSPVKSFIISFTQTGGDGVSHGALDCFSIRPLGTTFTASIYTQNLFDIIATIDENGIVNRNIYNDRRHIIATVEGRATYEVLKTMSIQTYSREGSQSLNSITQLEFLEEGGGFYELRGSKDTLHGWSLNSKISVNKNNEFYFQGSISQDFAFPLEAFTIRVRWGERGIRNNTQLQIADMLFEYVSSSMLTLTMGDQTKLSTSPNSPNPYDWLFFSHSGGFYFYIGDQLMFYSQKFSNSIQPVTVNIINLTEIISIKFILVGQRPSITTIYYDGLRSPRQSQLSLITQNSINSDNNAIPSASEAVAIHETLYDQIRNSKYTTLTTSKGLNAKYPNQIGFEDGFIKYRNPQDDTDIWLPLRYGGSGELHGLIDDWLNSSSKGNDRLYAYTANFYKPDPSNKEVVSTKAGEAFYSIDPYGYRKFYGDIDSISGATDDYKTWLKSSTLLSQYPSDKYQYLIKRFPIDNHSSLLHIEVSELQSKRIIVKFSSQLNQIGSNNITTLNITNQPAIGENGRLIASSLIKNLPNFYDDKHYSNNEGKFNNKIEYDYEKKVTSVVTSDTGKDLFFYDNDNLLRFSQTADEAANQICIYYLYDHLHRLIQISGIHLSAWDPVVLKNYIDGTDTPSNITTIIKNYYDAIVEGNINSEITQFENAQSKLVRKESWNVTLNSNLDVIPNSYLIQNYSYNIFGSTSSIQYSDSLRGDYSIQFSYSNKLELLKITYPKPYSANNNNNTTSTAVLYSYNLQGKVASVGMFGTSNDYDASYYAEYYYDENGNILTEILSPHNNPLIRTYQYNQHNKLISISDSKSFFTETYEYTRSNDNSKTIFMNSCYASFKIPNSDIEDYTYNYTYDAFGRLTAAVSNSPSNKIPSWTVNDIDANGNILEYNESNAGVTSSLTIQYESGTNRISKSPGDSLDQPREYAYSSSGFGFPAGESPIINLFIPRILSHSSASSHYIYDSEGERIAKNTSNIDVLYYRHQGGVVLQEVVKYSQSGNAYLLTYIYSNDQTRGALIAIHIKQTSGASPYDGVYFVLKDNLGSIRGIYNPNSPNSPITVMFNYCPWSGKLNVSNCFCSSNNNNNANRNNDGIIYDDLTISNLFRYRYIGKEIDENGLYNFHARLYDPFIYRFLSRDVAHQFPILYQYCAGNPIECVDDGRTLRFFETYFVIPEGDNPVLIIYDEMDHLAKIARKVRKSIIEITPNAQVKLISAQKLFANGGSTATLPTFDATKRYDFVHLVHGSKDQKIGLHPVNKWFRRDVVNYREERGHYSYTPGEYKALLEERMTEYFNNADNHLFYTCYSGMKFKGQPTLIEEFYSKLPPTSQVKSIVGPNGAMIWQLENKKEHYYRYNQRDAGDLSTYYWYGKGKGAITFEGNSAGALSEF